MSSVKYNAATGKWEEIETPEWLEEEGEKLEKIYQESAIEAKKQRDFFDKLQAGDVFCMSESGELFLEKEIQ